MKVICKEYFIH